MSDTLCIVNREKFSLRVYKWNDKRRRWRRNASYTVTVGDLAHTTPGGPYRVASKSVAPAWKVPSNADYAEESWGTIYTYSDPRNPFDGGFISLAGHPTTNGDGIGFHGTKFPARTGTRASHGCIRLETADLLDLYDRVPVGAEVWVE